jgi:hypothetical protein
MRGIDALEPGQSKQTWRGLLCLTSKAQKHESDERNGKQNTHCMIAAATKMLDIRCLREQ